MAVLFRYRRVNGVSDDAVKAKTGKKWDEWFKVLDKAGARMMDHRDIVAYVRDHLDLPRWWAQMVISGYEQEYGLRVKHRRGTRYRVDRSKVISAPLASVWAAWQDKDSVERWLPGAQFEVRDATPHKTMHLTWHDGTKVGVVFREKGVRTKIIVNHARLETLADTERVQSYWSEALERLKHVVAS